jgi:NADH-quinone oxidoreductase subunit N
LDRQTDWFGAMPEIVLLAFAIVVVLLDLFVNRKGVLAIVSIIGLIIAAFFSVAFWGTTLSFFNNMLAVDQFAVFFKLLFIGIAFLIILASADYIKKFARFQGEYYALILLC